MSGCRCEPDVDCRGEDCSSCRAWAEGEAFAKRHLQGMGPRPSYQATLDRAAAELRAMGFKDERRKLQCVIQENDRLRSDLECALELVDEAREIILKGLK